MDLSQIKVSTVILVIAGLALLIALTLSSATAVTIILAAKVIALVGIVLAFFGL